MAWAPWRREAVESVERWRSDRGTFFFLVAASCLLASARGECSDAERLASVRDVFHMSSDTDVSMVTGAPLLSQPRAFEERGLCLALSLP